MSERRPSTPPVPANSAEQWAKHRQELQRDQRTQAFIGMETRYAEDREFRGIGSGSQWVVYEYATRTTEVNAHIDDAASTQETAELAKEQLKTGKYVMKFLRPTLPIDSVYAVREKNGSRKKLGGVMEVVKRLRKEREFLAEQYEDALPDIMLKEHLFISRMRAEAAEAEPAVLHQGETRKQALNAGPSIASVASDSKRDLPFDILAIQERLPLQDEQIASKLSNWMFKLSQGGDHAFPPEEIETIREQLRTFIDITVDLASYPYSSYGKEWFLEDNEIARQRNPQKLDFDYALPDITHLGNLVVDRRSGTPTLRLMDTDFVLPPTETIANLEMIYERILFTIVQLEVGVFGKSPRRAVQELLAGFPPMHDRTESMLRAEELLHWLTDDKRFNTRQKFLDSQAKNALFMYMDVYRGGSIDMWKKRQLQSYTPEWIVSMEDDDDSSKKSDDGETTNLPSFDKTIGDPPKLPEPDTMPLPPKREYPATVELPAKPNNADTVPLPPKPEIVNESEEE